MLARQLGPEAREEFDEWLESPFETSTVLSAAQRFEQRQLEVEHPVGYSIVPEGEVIRFGSAS